MTKAKAKIVGVACRFRGEIYSMPRPARHCDVLAKISSETSTHWTGDMHWDQGFIDEDGVYLHRKAAKRRARQTGQLLERASEMDILFSEDVW